MKKILTLLILSLFVFGCEEEKPADLPDKDEEIVNLQSYINKNRLVSLGEGTYKLTAPLILHNATIITGIPGKTIIEAADKNITALISLTAPNDITISGITFKGFAPNSYVVKDLADVRNLQNIGTQSGISLTGIPNRVSISNCTFLNFNKAGFFTDNAMTMVQGVKVDNCFFSDCYVGCYIGERSEYGHYCNVSVNNCQIGIWVEAGNTLLSNIHADVNRVGFVVSGIKNNNDSHGSIANSTFNHNTLYSVLSTDISNGFTFNGCHVFDGDMCIFNSKGFSYVGGIVSAGIAVYKGAGTKSGNTSFIANTFIKGYGGGTINNSDNSIITLRDNVFIDGADNTTINN